MPAAPAIDFTACLAHEDAGVRQRAWAWQSAFGLLLVEGLQPSAYLVETARHHIEGGVSLDIIGKLMEAYRLTHPAAATGEADRRVLEMVQLLSAPAPSPVEPPPSVAAKAEPPAAPDDASALHLRHKRLLRTLGSQTLGVPELLHALRLSTRQSFMRVWLTPAVNMGLVKALHPNSPRHPQQKYHLTRKGQRFLKQLINK